MIEEIIIPELEEAAAREQERDWTDDQIAVLEKYWTIAPRALVAKHCGHSIGQCRWMYAKRAERRAGAQ